MAAADDIAKIIEQERVLRFPRFDEAAAFSIGLAIGERAARENLGLVCGIMTWDRPLFYCAMPGTTGDNQHWVRRKGNSVQRFAKSTYRMALEANGERMFPPGRAVDITEYALAGGGFPVHVEGAGIIGAVVISGLHERDDHAIAVEAIATHLGQNAAALALPPLNG